MQRQYNKNAIAIIGTSFRFPEAKNIDSLSKLIYQKKNAIKALQDGRWSDADFKTVSVGGFIDNIDGFCADFFSISEQEAKSMDPQHRLLLELSYEAFENAGLSKESLKGSDTGVYVGISTDDYSRIQQFNLDKLDTYLSTANAKSICANRISYFFDLIGPSIAIDTACSSSLVAVHQACMSLISGESNIALAAGVNLILNPGVSVALKEAGMLAKDNQCKVFDEQADGYVRGEGAGVVILKRLDDAVEDNDNILAVISGSVCNQDGLSNGITAPNGLAQQKVIQSALLKAGLHPRDIDYIEAHGTGTRLGDPVEINALFNVLKENRHHQCALGSIKANIGHLEAAAGIAGLIKSLVVLKEQKVPPLASLKNINPLIGDKEKAVFDFSKKTYKKTINHIGISSFGFGGSNAHLILSKAPSKKQINLDKKDSPSLLVLSAHNQQVLQLKGVQLLNYINDNKICISDLSHFLLHKRSHLDARLALVVNDLENSKSKIEAWLNSKHYASNCQSKGKVSKRLVWVFSGQGGQYFTMGRELFHQYPAFKKMILEANAIIENLYGWSLTSLFVK